MLPKPQAGACTSPLLGRPYSSWGPCHQCPQPPALKQSWSCWGGEASHQAPPPITAGTGAPTVGRAAHWGLPGQWPPCFRLPLPHPQSLTQPCSEGVLTEGAGCPPRAPLWSLASFPGRKHWGPPLPGRERDPGGHGSHPRPRQLPGTRGLQVGRSVHVCSGGTGQVTGLTLRGSRVGPSETVSAERPAQACPELHK